MLESPCDCAPFLEVPTRLPVQISRNSCTWLFETAFIVSLPSRQHCAKHVSSDALTSVAAQDCRFTDERREAERWWVVPVRSGTVRNGIRVGTLVAQAHVLLLYPARTRGGSGWGGSELDTQEFPRPLWLLVPYQGYTACGLSTCASEHY